ncbi:MAG: hypothetical protein IJV56_05260 [Neisseriaceae bacterium]|nr:hypothetical protein [Neisseriaceae bacterium]MBQ9724735.1 hypothetical protein [Neisseriaceae bacterium]
MSEQNSQDRQAETFAPVTDNATSKGLGSQSTLPNPPQSNDDGGSGSIFAIGLAIIALLGTGYNYWQMKNQAVNETATNVVVVDFDSIGSRLLMSGDSNEVLTKTQSLQDKLNELSAQGVVVLQKQSVVTAPAELDITDQLSQELGLSKTPNIPQSAPTVSQFDTPIPQGTITKETDGLDASLD